VRALAATYRRSGLQIKPVVRQILSHPALYRNLDAPDMVKAPIVYIAGALRTTGSYVTDGYPVWLSGMMGQQLFFPPSVAGWDWGPRWMSSNAVRQRFVLGNYIVSYGRPTVRKGAYKASTRPEQAVSIAIEAVGSPPVSAAERAALTRMAAHWFDDLPASWRDDADWRAETLQRTLRHLLVAGPGAQLC
jgi:uncharacterized protein (DUF1800 family)